MNNRNSVVVVAILIHMIIFFWSCSHVKPLNNIEELPSEHPRFIQAELTKEEDAKYIIKWETTPKNIGVDVAVSSNQQFKKEDQIGTDIRFNEFVFRKDNQQQLYFQLVVGDNDVIILSEEEKKVCR